MTIENGVRILAGSMVLLSLVSYPIRSRKFCLVDRICRPEFDSKCLYGLLPSRLFP